MAKKPSPEKPAPSSLLPGFQHLIPSAAAAPLAAHIRPLFLPDLVQQIARNKQIDANRREQAHPAFRKWAKDLKQGVLQQLHETQVEQDFNHVLLRGLGYTTQSDVAADQPWTLTPKWNVPGSGEVDAALGTFRLDEAGHLSGQPLVMVELKGAKVDLDRKMPTRNITPVQQVWSYLNASESAQWAVVCNYAEIRLYSRQKSSNHVHRVFLTELDDPDKFAEFYAIFHAASLLGTGLFAQNTGWLLRETGERQEKVSVDLYREYAERRVELIQELQSKGVTELDRAIEAAQRLLDRILFIAFAEDRGLLPDRNLLKHTSFVRVAGLTAWQAFQLLFRSIDKGDPINGIPKYNGNLFKPDPILDDLGFALDSGKWPQVFVMMGEFDYRHEVTVDVLGRIFERSITDIEEIKAKSLAQHATSLAERRRKPGRRKEQGVYYTADYIVNYLVSAALDPLWEQARADLAKKHGVDLSGTAPPTASFLGAMLTWLDGVTLCDPACGSGAFLIAAYDWFLNHRLSLLDDLSHVEPGDPDCAGSHDDWIERSAPLILQNNLYGVDISPESVEIAQLSLWIRTARPGQPLTDLSSHIRCGNSVVDDPAVDPKAFDWNAQFPSVFETGGFDAVVGNPPYVRQERLQTYKLHWKERFPGIFDSTGDLYVFFFGRALGVLRPGGRLAFVCSSSFARAGFGAKLRSVLQTDTALERFLDLGDTCVFTDAKDVYPALVVVSKRAPLSSDGVIALRVRKSDDVTQIAKLVVDGATKIPLGQLSASGWQFESSSVHSLRAKMLASDSDLARYVNGKILFGIKTGLNDAFVVDDETKIAIIRASPSAADLIRPYRGGENLRRWFQEESRKWLICLTNGFTRTMSNLVEEGQAWRWLQDQYPGIAQHLSPYEEAARKREDQGQFWWELRPCDYYEAFASPKIVYPDISNHARFSMEETGCILGNTAYLVPVQDYYLLAVLNSRATWFALSGISIPFGERLKKFRYRLFTQYLSRLPVPMTDIGDRAELELLAHRLSQLSRERYELIGGVARRLNDMFNSAPDANIPEHLNDWPSLSFKALGDHLKRRFKLKQVPWNDPRVADEWEGYVTSKSKRCAELSERIICAEEEINRRVYRLFDLTRTEVKILVEETSF